MIHSLAGDKPKQWDQSLPQAKLAFNSMVNRSTGQAPFNIVYTKARVMHCLANKVTHSLVLRLDDKCIKLEKNLPSIVSIIVLLKKRKKKERKKIPIQ